MDALPKTKKRYRILMGWLDKKGIACHIEKEDNSFFTLTVNFEIVKSAKTRRTLNKRIEKLFLEQEINK